MEARTKSLESSPRDTPPASIAGASTPGGAWAAGPSSAVLAGMGGTFASTPRPAFGSAFGGSPFGSPLGSPGGRDFDRLIDQTILKISAAKSFSRIEATNVANLIIRDAGIPPLEFDVEGNTPNNTYTIRFSENFDSAASHVRKILAAQKLGPKEWRKYQVSCPGDTTASPDTKELLFINPDKNGRQVKLEVGARKLTTYLKDKHPGKDIVCLSKLEGIVGVAGVWKAVAKVVVVSSSDVQVEWNPVLVQSIGVDTKLAMEHFNADIGYCSGIQWTRG